MAAFTLDFTFPDGSAIEVVNSTVKYWICYGLPDYEGDLDGYSKQFPEHFQYLLDRKILKEVD